MKIRRGWVSAFYLEFLDSLDEAEDLEFNYVGVFVFYGYAGGGIVGVRGYGEVRRDCFGVGYVYGWGRGGFRVEIL